MKLDTNKSAPSKSTSYESGLIFSQFSYFTIIARSFNRVNVNMCGSFIARINLNRSFFYFYELFYSRKTRSPVSKFKKPKQLNHFNDDIVFDPIW